jgi:hypothetical protein
MGRELIITILHKFHLWFNGICNLFLPFSRQEIHDREKSILVFLKRFVGALPISCSKADQRNQTSSVLGQILSTTSSV